MKKHIRLWSCFVVVTLFAGCLTSETEEYRITLNKDRKSGTMTTLKRNIQSDESGKEKQQEDFDHLIHDWKSDEYLLDKTKEGVYVKERSLYVEKGQLCWKEISIFSDFMKMVHEDVADDTLRMTFKNKEVVLATNGTLIQTRDSSVVLWSVKSGEFTLKVRPSKFEPKSDFVAMFETSRKKK